MCPKPNPRLGLVAGHPKPGPKASVRPPILHSGTTNTISGIVRRASTKPVGQRAKPREEPHEAQRTVRPLQVEHGRDPGRQPPRADVYPRLGLLSVSFSSTTPTQRHERTNVRPGRVPFSTHPNSTSHVEPLSGSRIPTTGTSARPTARRWCSALHMSCTMFCLSPTQSSGASGCGWNGDGKRCSSRAAGDMSS